MRPVHARLRASTQVAGSRQVKNAASHGDEDPEEQWGSANHRVHGQQLSVVNRDQGQRQDSGDRWHCQAPIFDTRAAGKEEGPRGAGHHQQLLGACAPESDSSLRHSASSS